MRRASYSSTTLLLALRGLVGVEAGLSERGALARLRRVGDVDGDLEEALRIILATLDRRNLIDQIVFSGAGTFPDDPERLRIFRLAVHLLLFDPEHESSPRNLVERLTGICPTPHRRAFDKFVGYLLSVNDAGIFLKHFVGTERLSLETGYPNWWVEYCINLWGRNFAVALLNAKRRSRYLRLNPRRPSDLPVELRALESVEGFPGFYRTENKLQSNVRQLIDLGDLQAQDLASFLAVESADPIKGEHVLEICGAPGAKTLALSHLMEGSGCIVSIDYSMKRMDVWRRTMARLGIRNASGLICDGASICIRKEASFDLVFLDPPCSGSGILDRNPRMKWHLSARRLERYSQLQYSLLAESSKYLSPEGRIVYSTCSVSLEENEGVISRFLAANPDFETRPILSGMGHTGLRGFSNCRRFYPHLDDTAGYFVARLERVN